MNSGLDVVAHPTGPWLVRAGAVVYAVPPKLGRCLSVWQGKRPTAGQLAAVPPPPDVAPNQWSAFMASLAAGLHGGARPTARRVSQPVWLRLPLVPARVVRRAARPLGAWAGPRGLLGLGLVGLAGYGHLVLTAAASPIRPEPGTLGLALGLFGVTALWHEFGHAAAISRAGYPPGGIGAGLLFVIPVLFADVTAVGVLPRAGRIRVDLAGVVFQFGLGGLLALVGAAAGAGQAPRVGSWLALAAVGWNLFPFIRADGYWLVCDLLGVPELEVDPDPPPRRAVRWVLSLYRVANAIFLLGVGILLPARYIRRGTPLLERLGWDLHRPEVAAPLLAAAGIGLALAWGNILRRVWRLGRAAIRLNG